MELSRYVEGPDPGYFKVQRWRLPELWLLTPYSRGYVVYFAYIHAILDLLPPSARVLDLGCGDGRFASEAVSRGHTVIGLDYSARAVGFARLLVPGAEFQVVDLTCLESRPPLG